MKNYTTEIMMMSKVVLIFVCLSTCSSSLFAQNSSSSCPAYTSFANKNRYTACNALPVLNSFLHWNYYKLNNSIDIAYIHTGITPSNWVVWSINPSSSGMIGSQCLVAMFNSTTNSPRVYTSSVSGYNTRMQEGPLNLFSVPSMRAEYSNGQMIIYASIVLPTGRTSFQQVWQHGVVSRSGIPMAHPMTQDHLTSFSNIDFATGETVNTGGSSGAGGRSSLKQAHGLVNVVSWGIMMPLGAMAARYLKVFLPGGNPTWFYIHVACQASAYVVGFSGFVTGAVLGFTSRGGVHHTLHIVLGSIIFLLGTLQASAIFFRPKPDHKNRIYWDWYHHCNGWAVIGLSIANVFVGLNILDPHKKWTIAYAAVVIAIIAVAACFEAFSLYRKRKNQTDSSKQPANGSSHLVNADSA